MTAEERIATLEEQLKQALEQVHLLQEQLAAAQKRIEELEKQKTPPPAFAKANVKKPAASEKKRRKKRAAQHNHGRRREAPTRIIEHSIVSCPVCASRLGGVSVARRRQVIELPPPPPVEVTEHGVYHGWCSECRQWREAPLDVSAEVLGQGRVARED
jgi:transposase